MQIAIVYTATGGQLYSNGVSSGGLAGSGQLATSTMNISLGNDGGSGDDVNMNSVRIYNRALSAAEIAALYSGGR